MDSDYLMRVLDKISDDFDEKYKVVRDDPSVVGLRDLLLLIKGAKPYISNLSDGSIKNAYDTIWSINLTLTERIILSLDDGSTGKSKITVVSRGR